MEILNGFDYLFSNTSALIFVFLGAVVGMVVGAIPGLSAAAAIAMIVPATFYLDPLSALGFLYVLANQEDMEDLFLLYCLIHQVLRQQQPQCKMDIQ